MLSVTGNLFGVIKRLITPQAKNSDDAIERTEKARDYIIGQYAEPGRNNAKIFKNLGEFRRVLANQKLGLETYVGDLQITKDNLICFNGNSKQSIGRYVPVQIF